MYQTSPSPKLSDRPKVGSSTYLGFVGDTFLDDWGAEIRRNNETGEVTLYAERNYKYYGDQKSFKSENDLDLWLDAIPHDNNAQLVNSVLKKLGV